MLVSMSVIESEVKPSGGFCFRCGNAVDGDIMEHCAEMHQRVSSKPTTEIKSWRHRLDAVVEALTEVRQESASDVQIRTLDERVIKELYLVRHQILQSAKKG